MHLPRPIDDDIDYDNTLEVIDRLATQKHLLPDQEEYLQTLSILVEKYDRDHFDDSVVSDSIGRLKRLMEHHDLTASDVGRILGNRSLGAAILRGQRKISKASALKLGEYFKLSPSAFFQV
jgi:HTH-type transcriptional regulator/antitoxin HigA